MKYLFCFLLGLLIAFTIGLMIIESMMWENARLSNTNYELRLQKVDLKYELAKATKYNSTLTYNFNHNMYKKDKEIEKLRR